MTGAALVAHFLTLACQLTASAWQAHHNPLLRWDVVRLLTGDYRVEVVQQQYGDYWRVQVFPVSASPYSAPLLSAAGPWRACQVTVIRSGSWPVAVMAALPLPMSQDSRRYG